MLGILSWVGFGCFTGIPAWYLGNVALYDIAHGRADPRDRGIIQAGRMLGLINVVLVMVAIPIFILMTIGLPFLLRLH